MNKFWNWYDSLASEHATLRFALFMSFAIALYVLIPGIIAFICGIKYFHPASYVGIAVLGLFALSKHFRWPK